MSKSELSRLVKSETARWRVFDKSPHGERERYSTKLIDALAILLDSAWPWPRVKSCIGAVLSRVANAEGYPTADRVLAQVRTELKPKEPAKRVCFDCERGGGIGIYADSPPAINDAVYGIDGRVEDEAPHPMCPSHYSIFVHRRWQAIRGIEVEALKPPALCNQAELLATLKDNKRKDLV